MQTCSMPSLSTSALAPTSEPLLAVPCLLPKYPGGQSTAGKLRGSMVRWIDQEGFVHRSEWKEEERLKWLMQELTGKRPLMPPGMETTPDQTDVINTFRTLAQLPPDSLAAYVISMAHTASDVLAVVLLQVCARLP